jgi:hypothetical protein
VSELITSHPYLDNNGPNYVYGVCEHPSAPRCHRSVREHSTRITAKTGRSKRSVVSTAPAYRDASPV